MLRVLNLRPVLFVALFASLALTHTGCGQKAEVKQVDPATAEQKRIEYEQLSRQERGM